MDSRLIFLLGLLLLFSGRTALFGFAMADTPRQQLVITHTQKQRSFSIEENRRIHIWEKNGLLIFPTRGKFTIQNDSTIQIKRQSIPIADIRLIRIPETGKRVGKIFTIGGLISAGIGGIMTLMLSGGDNGANSFDSLNSASGWYLGGLALLVVGILSALFGLLIQAIFFRRKILSLGRRRLLGKYWRLSVQEMK